MKNGYRVERLTFNRQAVAASASVARAYNTIHTVIEVDIVTPRKIMREHREKTGESLSLTAYVVTCLAEAVSDYPRLNAFRKGKKLILLDDITISVLIEREIQGESVPEPLGITGAQTKSFRQIHSEIREAQKTPNDQLGSLSGIAWVRFVPVSLLRLFIRSASRSINMAKRYGKVAVTAVGMFSHGSAWFIPLSSATVLVTVGGITNKVIVVEGQPEEREHLCLTVSFDHSIVDGAPAARFAKRFSELIKSGTVLL